jgi:hypothetical protein
VVQATFRGATHYFCTPDKAVQDSKECESQTQQLLLLEIAGIELATSDQRQRAQPLSNSLRIPIIVKHDVPSFQRSFPLMLIDFIR